RTVYRAPANKFVADFIGETNWLPGTVAAVNGDGVEVETTAGHFVVASTGAALTRGMRVALGFRPEAVVIATAAVNCLRTRIAHVTYLGEFEQYRLELSDGVSLKAFEQNPREIRQLGAALEVHVRPQDCLVLPA
ncbi:MAG: TOBE domain-containing protein, partial [Candidatus Binatia bacterium]